MLIWETLTAFGLVCVLVHVSAVGGQVCTKLTNFGLRNCFIANSSCYQCTISTSSDYAGIPGDVVAMRLIFSSGSTGLNPSARLPSRVQLRELEMSLSNLGQSPVIPSGFFSSVEQLDVLTIYTNVHSSIGFNAQFINGSFSGLSNLTRFTAAALGITELPVGVFKDLVRLRQLDLNQNRLTSVAAGTFAQQRQLTTLSLAKNQISSFVNVSFAGLESLQTIDLYMNEIRSLGKSLEFLALKNLTKINLGSNQMVRIDPYAFTGLRRLEQLFLDDNNLTNLTMNVFNDLTNLAKLALWRNALQRLPANLFSNLGSLDTLDLSENYLESVPAGFFNGLQKLKTLNLGKNRIQSVEDQGFAGLESLETLDLSDNQIAVVESDAFPSLRRLESLNLANNHLISLDLGTTDGFDVGVLSHLDLSLNPWNCSCDNYWLVLWLRMYNLTSIVANPDSTKCQSPLEWRNRTLLAVYDDTNHSCPFPFPVETTQTTVSLTPTGSARKSDEGGLSKEAQIGIIIAAVVAAVLIIVIVAVIVHFRLKRIGFWDRTRSAKVNGMHIDAAKNDSAASDVRLRPEVESDGGYVNRWVISDDGSSHGQGELEAHYPGSGSADVGFAIVTRAGSPCGLKSQNESYVYDNPTLLDNGRHM